MNLAAVKRADPYAKEIVETSAHVAFYTFNNEWEKTDVEGAFFVYKRTAEPFHSIFINNRLNTNSLVEPITADLELQAQPPFLLYRNERSRIRGFWFYNKDELERVCGLVNKLVKECQKRGGPQQQQQQSQMANVMASNNHFKATNGSGPHDVGGMNGGDPQMPPKNPVNIFSMLSRAQEEFYNSTAVPKGIPPQMMMIPQTGGGGGGPNNGPPPPMPMVDGGSMLAALLPKMNVNNNNHNNGGQQQQKKQPQQQNPQVQSKDAVTSQSVMNFFASAAKPTTIPPPQQHPHQQQQQQHQHQPPPQPQMHSNGGGGLKVASPAPPALLQRLMSNPVHTVEQIEMQHRALTPQEMRPATSGEDHGPLVSAENGFNWKVAKGGEGLTPVKNAKNGGKEAWPALFQAKPGNGGVAAAAVASEQTKERPGKVGKGQQPGTPSNQAAAKPALMTPTMFKKTAEPLSKVDPTNPSLIATGAKREAKAQQAANKGGGAGVDLTIKPEPLTRSQMLQAMTYLMKTDGDFMKKLHEAYLKSFAEMMAQ